MAKKRTSPLLIGFLVIFIALLIIGFLSGPLGKTTGIQLPAWLSLPKPEPELPAEEVFSIFHIPVTNTVVAAWLTIIFLVVFSIIVTRRMKIVPGRLQAAFEALVGWLYDFCTSVAGEHNGRRFFPVVATIFLFVAFNAWLGLLPGFGAITTVNPEGHQVHLLRGANTDINMPLALALISFICVLYFGLKAVGIGYLGQYFHVGPLCRSIGQIFKGKFNGMDIILGAVSIFVGFLELLSMFIRVVSFTFRLFGVSTAGEILLLVGMFLGIRVLIEFFYGLELLFGFVQALIFAGLTLVFLTVASAGHGEHTEQ